MRKRATVPALFLSAAIVIAACSHWEIRSAGYDPAWGKDLEGYYDYLARGFAGGHLYLPLDPSPELLAQPNPWDANGGGSQRLFDAVLYNKRFYLYHGAGPAVMLFLPYRLITRHDLPENYALFLFCFGGYLFSAASMIELIHLTRAYPPPALLALMLLAVGICPCIPYLMSRVWVYEVAVGAGYFSLSSAVFFLLRSYRSPRLQWAIAAGFMSGMAIACRPHMVLAGLIALTAICFTGRRRAIAFAAPFVAAGFAIAAYNFARFGNPFEFGNNYMMTAANMGKLRLSMNNLPPGAYFMLFVPPHFDPVFPWIRLAWPPGDFPRPANYIVEPTVGAIWLAPFTACILLIGWMRDARRILLLLVAAAVAILSFIAATGWSVQRYEADFLPLLVLAALCCAAMGFRHSRGAARWALVLILVSSIAFGIIVNLALGISGPYDEMLQNRPARYVKIAGWFSPVARYRPELDPKLNVRFRAEITPGPGQTRRDLFSAGRARHQYELYVEPSGERLTLISRSDNSTVTYDLGTAVKTGDFEVTYSPEDRAMHVLLDGRPVINHRIGELVTAPSQVLVARYHS